MMEAIKKVKRQQINLKYRLKNKEKESEKKKEYYLKNKERLIQKKKEYYQKNREIVIQYQQRYQAENKEKLQEYWAKKNKEKNEDYVPRKPTVYSWKNAELVRSNFESLAKLFDISELVDWYRVSRIQLKKAGGIIYYLFNSFGTFNAIKISET